MKSPAVDLLGFRRESPDDMVQPDGFRNGEDLAENSQKNNVDGPDVSGFEGEVPSGNGNKLRRSTPEDRGNV